MNSDSSSRRDQPQVVKVTLLLRGGHEHTIFLHPEHSLLKQLVSAVVTRGQSVADNQTGYFQIPVDQGYASLIVGRNDVIGIITQPPIVLQSPPVEQSLTSEVKSLEEANKIVVNPEDSPTSSETIPSSFVQLHNILSDQEVTKLLDYVFTREVKFVPTQTSTQDVNYRQSFILYEFPEFASLMQERISELLPDVLTQFNIPLFKPSQIEVQLTAHNDGNYYKVHNDNGSPDTATRQLTYVYYFYQTPKPFTGGELRIYDSRIKNGYYIKAETFKDVEPINNSIVLFPSGYLHEVLPIRCPSKDFTDSRFTINGWVRRD